jgi:two-component system nitrogen regulation sensor histidine kinase NtrY
MKNFKALFGLLLISFLAIIITGIVLNNLGIEHGSLLIKIGFIFIVVNIVLYLIILIFYVFRNLVHLYSEKRRKAIGSKFRTKLTASFLGLVLIPSVLLFFLSSQLINNSIDTWFSLEIQKPIYESMDIARTLYFKERQNVKNYARILSLGIPAGDKNELDVLPDAFRAYLLEKKDGTALVESAFKGKSDTAVLSTEKGDIIRAAAPVRREGRITGVIVVETVIPQDIVSKLESIQSAFNEYVQIRAQQNPVRFIYFLMLSIATLLIIFLALWISFRIARGITVPIQSLAEATETVAHGNLDFRMNLIRDDEIGMLMNSFNHMLDDLQQGKQSLEEAYRESDQRRASMESILESINSGVIFFDRAGKTITVNNAACALLSAKRNAIEGKTYRDLLLSLKSDELIAMVKHLSERGFGAVEKEIHIHLNGRPMDLRVYATIIKDSSKRFIGTLAVFDNLTEIIMAQRALAWQEVAKRIAHEIKNPLTPIRLSAERLLKKWNDRSDDFDEVIARSTKTIVHEVDSLRSLVDEFSRFGKMPKINLEPTRLESIIEEVVELYSNHKDISITHTFNGAMPEIPLDRKQIKMALINLIDNAIQAQTRSIMISARYNASLEIIGIEVADEGTGIREEDKDKLFFPYFSTKKEGTGLGLAIVNSIISRHRGYIRVQDNEPKGTRFIIELPVERE